MPIKYPCITCKKPVKCNQKGIFCEACKLWVHSKCTNLSKAEYDFLETNIDVPYFCQKCRPKPFVADEIHNSTTSNVNTDEISLVQDDTISSDTEFSDAHSSDFTLESADENESDSDLRGLNFSNLPLATQLVIRLTLFQNFQDLSCVHKIISMLAISAVAPVKKRSKIVFNAPCVMNGFTRSVQIYLMLNS